jgi:hypothetical protein
MAGDALTALLRYLVLSLDCEQVVTKKAMRLHCRPVPRNGSDTKCGRAATNATAAIVSVLDVCQMNFIARSDFETSRVRFADKILCERFHSFEIERTEREYRRIPSLWPSDESRKLARRNTGQSHKPSLPLRPGLERQFGPSNQ